MARIVIVLGRGKAAGERRPEASLEESYEAAHARLAAEASQVIDERRRLQAAGKLARLEEAAQAAAEQLYIDSARKLREGLEAVVQRGRR